MLCWCSEILASLEHQTVIDTISKINSKNKTSSNFTCNLFTPYKRILHRKLKSVIEELINFSFNGGVGQFIGITRYGAIWTNNQHRHELIFNKRSLKLEINYLLDNDYFAMGSMCFRQVT